MVIEKAWLKRYSGNDLGSTAEALKIVTKELKSWSRSTFDQVTKQLESLREELDKLERDDPVGNRAAILAMKHELDEVLFREEMMWLQRSRLSWLKEGDRNTEFFHQKARWRAAKTSLKS